jgi:outer membrane lipoprotein-sorting protein
LSAFFVAALAVPLLVLLVVFWPAPSWALVLSADDKADVARIEAYLNGIKTLKARFIQVSPGGAFSSGGFWLRRPGRLRFEYDPPVPYLILANSVWLIFYDAELGQPQHWPINETPLGVLIADQVSLTRDTDIEAISRSPGRLAVTLRQKSRPDDGAITLVFSDAPLILRQWRIIDAQGQPTTVTLNQIERGLELPIELFVLPDDFRLELRR